MFDYTEQEICFATKKALKKQVIEYHANIFDFHVNIKQIMRVRNSIPLFSMTELLNHNDSTCKF